MTTILKRVQIAEPDPTQLSQDVLNYAVKNFGYRHPEVEHSHLTGELTTALRVMGLRPFDRVSVELYKSAKAAMRLRRCWERSCKVVEDFIGVAAIGASYAFAFIGFMMHVLTLHDWTAMGLLQHWSVAVAVATTVIFFVARLVWPKFTTTATWVCVPLRGYDSPVPEFALATAMEVHQRVPHVQLAVDELRVQHDAWVVRKADPFLVAKLGDEEYYLEVWAEPGYKQKRLT
jgi:hypothetical protein